MALQHATVVAPELNGLSCRIIHDGLRGLSYRVSDGRCLGLHAHARPSEVAANTAALPLPPPSKQACIRHDAAPVRALHLHRVEPRVVYSLSQAAGQDRPGSPIKYQ